MEAKKYETLLEDEKLRSNSFKELAEEQRKKTKKYKQMAEELKNKNEELMQEIKKLNISHPNQTIKEEKKEYSDYLGENNNSETEEIFKLKKNYKILQEKLDDEVTRTEVLKTIAEGERQKFEKILNKYQAAQDINDELINKLKMKDENYKGDVTNSNQKKNSGTIKEKNNDKEKNKLKEELKEKNKIIQGLNDNIQKMKNANHKLMSLNEENSKKIKELNNRLEEYKNSKQNNNENDNDNKEYGFKKLISVMNIQTKEENDENETKKNSEEMAKHRDKRNPTARFGGYDNDNEDGNQKIFMFERDNEDE